jgi:ankyrin repeat protein
MLSACSGGSRDVIEALLAAGANVNVKARKQDGEADSTPLMVAAEDSDLWCVRRLLAAGADPAAQTSRKETAIHYALKRYFVGPRPKPEATHVVRELLAAGCPLAGTELHYAVYCRDVEMTRLLLDHGSPLDVPLAAKNSLEKDGPRKGDTPLKVLERPNAIDLSGGVLVFEPTDARRDAIAALLRSGGARS